MKCPLCQTEMIISRSRNTLENDDTPDIPTKLFIEQDLKCRNRECKNYDQVVDTVKTELPLN